MSTPLSIVAESNATAHREALLQYADLTGKGLIQSLRDEARLLLKQVIEFTPPQGDDDSTPRTQGRNAVERDIHRAIRPIDPSFESESLNKSITRLADERDYDALQTIYDRIGAGVKVRPFSPAIHQQARASRGRVPDTTKPVLTPDTAELNAYVKTVQNRVGRGKGGWALAYVKLGGKPANWIRKWVETGTFYDTLANFKDGAIEQTNRSEWARGGDEDRIIDHAIKTRTAAIATRVAHAQAKAGEHMR